MKLVVQLSQTRLETPRLRLRPVIGNRRISQAFELIQSAGIKAGLQLPSDLSYQAFRAKLMGEEPFALFLMEERAGGEPIGLAGVWSVSPNRGWPQILYAVRPESRGRGYAQEGSEVLVQTLLKSESVLGVGAIVVGFNPRSAAVLEKLGMGLIYQWEDRAFYGLCRQQFQEPGQAPASTPAREAETGPASAIERWLRSPVKRLLDRYEQANTGTISQKFVVRVHSWLLALIEGRSGRSGFTAQSK